MAETRYKAVIIDDEIWTREVIKRLGTWDVLGIEVAGEASDGEYGLELIRRLRPDIILTDVRMPQLNGIDLVGLLRREGNDARVLIISGYDDYDYIRSALRLGVTDYLLKPIKAEELNAQLRRCREELSGRAVQQGNREELLAAGFDQAAWAGDYVAMQNEVRDALRARSRERLHARFKAMGALVVANEGAQPPTNVMIGIYYTLENLLRRFIVDSGYTIPQIYGEGGNAFVFSRDVKLDDMMAFLCTLFCTAVRRVEDLQHTRSRLDIAQIHKYAADHCTEGITLEKTADRFYVSMEYLSKLFKSTYGEGFTEYVTRLRMEKARELIGTGLPLKEVGAAVGYYDQAHFYKTFKKFFGKAPGQYRQDLQEAASTPDSGQD